MVLKGPGWKNHLAIQRALECRHLGYVLFQVRQNPRQAAPEKGVEIVTANYLNWVGCAKLHQTCVPAIIWPPEPENSIMQIASQYNCCDKLQAAKINAGVHKAGADSLQNALPLVICQKSSLRTMSNITDNFSYLLPPTNFNATLSAFCAKFIVGPTTWPPAGV